MIRIVKSYRDNCDILLSHMFRILALHEFAGLLLFPGDKKSNSRWVM